MLMPSTWTARRTRAYTSTFSTSPVSHKTQLARDVLLDLNCGGLLFDRHAAPLPRRYVVNYCSGLYIHSIYARISGKKCTALSIAGCRLQETCSGSVQRHEEMSRNSGSDGFPCPH